MPILINQKRSFKTMYQKLTCENAIIQFCFGNKETIYALLNLERKYLKFGSAELILRCLRICLG